MNAALQIANKPTRRVPPASLQVDLFKGRYKVDTVISTYICAKQSDLKALLGGLGTQATLIAYVFNELYEKGICELKYKAITITDTEWTKSSGVYNPTREAY